MHFQKQFKLIIWVIVAITILGTLFGISSDLIGGITNILLSIGISVIISGVCGQIVEALPGSEILKKISLNKEIFGINFSVTLFAVLTILLKLYLFK